MQDHQDIGILRALEKAIQYHNHRDDQEDTAEALDQSGGALRLFSEAQELRSLLQFSPPAIDSPFLQAIEALFSRFITALRKEQQHLGNRPFSHHEQRKKAALEKIFENHKTAYIQLNSLWGEAIHSYNDRELATFIAFGIEPLIITNLNLSIYPDALRKDFLAIQASLKKIAEKFQHEPRFSKRSSCGCVDIPALKISLKEALKRKEQTEETKKKRRKEEKSVRYGTLQVAHPQLKDRDETLVTTNRQLEFTQQKLTETKEQLTETADRLTTAEKKVDVLQQEQEKLKVENQKQVEVLQQEQEKLEVLQQEHAEMRQQMAFLMTQLSDFVRGSRPESSLVPSTPVLSSLFEGVSSVTSLPSGSASASSTPPVSSSVTSTSAASATTPFSAGVTLGPQPTTLQEQLAAAPTPALGPPEPSQ